mmetsp:Transcript_40265/g.83859  ORF Transcript_40265/g.83859 Transcript_40265/m.83859 type:complete len:242 (-) Transcript_40265:157-882(-)|eukprot:CAMPEP_0172444676 /NCGR_PEP_ID=MMETSP1065-20121228/4680_1 /TAXON_ID=265537 /ORGANISM="Amphiprora paludosa, Strain CCMP125" /LENGTH=241 /DNA_ID=CAMNT_0013195303 /DNA_START=256 /DNA_END=981 /DNA_ORIENTATION=+
MINLTEPISNMQEPIVVIQPQAPMDCFGWGDFPAVSAGAPQMMLSSVPSSPCMFAPSLHLVEDSSSSFEYDTDASSAMDISTTASSDESYASLTKQNEERRLVQFATVHVREHALLLGDHPSAEEYPLTLDWKHASPIQYDINEFEHHYRTSTTCFIRGSSSKACLPRRLSPADRRLRLAAVNGESISQVFQEETDRRRQQMQSTSTLRSAASLSHTASATSINMMIQPGFMMQPSRSLRI